MRFIKKNFNIDNTGKTKAFFCKKEIIKIDDKLINNILKYSKIEKNNFRLCLHTKKTDKLHNMLIFLHKRNNVTVPHKHLKKEEVYQIVKGKIKVTLFFKKKIIFILSKQNPIIRVPKNTFHLVESMSDTSIFHELRSGPFKKNDSFLLRGANY
jgi:cupin fold WbuC family metalloprotein